MSRSRRTPLAAGLALLASLTAVGCVRRQMDAFPWGTALQGRGAASADLEGTYLNVGQVTWSPGASTQLFGLIFQAPPPPGPPEALKIRLRPEGGDQVRVEALREGQVLASRVLTLRRVTEDAARWGEALRMEKPTESGPSNLGVGWDSGSVDFRRGVDGCLYAEVRGSGGGLLFYVVPFCGASTHWMRWEPATP